MTATNKPRGSFRDLLFRALGAKTADEKAEILEEAKKIEEPGEHDEEPGEHTHVHVHMGGAGAASNTLEGDPTEAGDEEAPSWFKKHAEQTDARFKDIEGKLGSALEKWAKQEAAEPAHQGDEVEKEIEGALKEEAPEGTGDEEIKKTKDSAFMADSFQNTLALAEIIAPGIGLPTFDSAAPKKKTFDAMCSLRRKALDLAWNVADTRSVIEDVTGKSTLDLGKMSCRDVRGVFLAVGAAKKRANAARDVSHRDVGASVGKVRSIADLNKANAEYYGARH